jgi:late competence protein required for DNA uptake (superfamily II DNA/RNA helicase)
MGAGKTSQTIQHLKTYLKTAFATNVEIYVPRHDIADESERRFRDDERVSANVVHMYGRGGIDLQIPPLCKRYEYVQ